MTTCRLKPALAICAAVALLAPAGPSPLEAASGRTWAYREASHYNDARLDHVTVSPDGRLSLAPAVERLAEVSQPFLWCLAVDSRGRLYAGGGNEGKVVRLEPSGAVEEIFDASEVEVHALAVDGEDRLYVGTSPDGKVYRISGDGEAEPFFDPGATYIWALAFGGDGSLLVATGQPARVQSVSPDGRARTLLESREDHIRSLAPDGKGGFLAGSDGGGVIYRIAPDGSARVLYDTPEHEIAALAVAGEHVYAAALSPRAKGKAGGSRSETRGNVTTVRVTADGGGEADDGDDGGQQGNDARRRQAQQQYEGAVYTVSTDGYARKIWSSSDRLPLALTPAASGGVLVGTDGGRILSLDPHGQASEVALLESEQVNALAPGPGGLFAVTSNLGALFRVAGGYAREGTVTGGVRDAGFRSRWGAITWDGVVPSGTEVRFEVRTGDTEEPDESWTPWSGPYRESRGSVIESAPARFLQWRAVMTSRKGEATPALRAVQIHYMPDNMPPVLESVEVMDPGVWLQPSGAGRRSRGGRSATPAPPKRASQPGMRSVQWTASDENQDPLEADVLFKAEDESVWRTLETQLEDGFFAWDSRAMPDGLYRIRVVITDSPGNPTGEGLTDVLDSAAFEVDNTPPTVTVTSARREGGAAVVTATVADSFSVIGEIAYAVDAGEWTIVLPEDGVADSATEKVRFSTEDLGPGEHSIVIRAADRAGNFSAGKAILKAAR